MAFHTGHIFRTDRTDPKGMPIGIMLGEDGFGVRLYELVYIHERGASSTSPRHKHTRSMEEARAQLDRLFPAKKSADEQDAEDVDNMAANIADDGN